MKVDLIILLIFGVISFFIFRKWLRSEKIHNNTVIGFFGGLGAGKTFMAVHYIVKRYRKDMFLYKLKLRKVKPHVVSNIPIRLSKKEWSAKLTREHLLMNERLPEQAYILIDEGGDVFGQMDYDNANVIGSMTEFIRFYRHYINGKFIFTDQSLLNIIYSVKRRTAIAYMLSNFHKGFMVPTYTIHVDVLKVSNGDLQNVNILDQKQKQTYFYGLIPRRKYYDTRCYSIRYNPENEFKPKYWNTYKTDYVIDLSVDKAKSKKKVQTFKWYMV